MSSIESLLVEPHERVVHETGTLIYNETTAKLYVQTVRLDGNGSQETACVLQVSGGGLLSNNDAFDSAL